MRRLRLTLLLAGFVSCAAANDSIKGLPVIERLSKNPQPDVFVVIVTGDGGWVSLDRRMAKTFNENGIDVVGLDALKYFWKKKTPEKMGQDLERLLRHYFAAWKKDRVILVGYSRGADVLPFMINRLPADLRPKISLVALLGLEHAVEFVIRVGGALNLKAKHEQSIQPEVDQLKGINVVCFYGDQEKDSLCRELPPELADVRKLKGGHHFDGDYEGIARQILEKARP